jgi:hypothetical protein
MKNSKGFKFSNTSYLKEFYFELERAKPVETIEVKKTASIGITVCNIELALEVEKKNNRFLSKA